MVESKGWNWSKVDHQPWLVPSEDGIYLKSVWKQDGARSVLDLGCGLGRHSIMFAQEGFKVTACDLSEDAVASVKKLSKESKLDITCCVADMKHLPFADEAFDRVFSYHVISHTDTQGVQEVIDEITRVLKPEGKLFMTLCSKEHYAFTEPSFLHVDENTVLKTEAAEDKVPHFFADLPLMKKLFHDYTFTKVRHITDCNMEDLSELKRSHYHIEAVVHKKAAQLDYSSIIGSVVDCTIDRPAGSTHPKHPDLYYPINYGYVNGIFAADGAEQDIYVLGVTKPLWTLKGKVIAVYHRFNDVEDKWIVVPEHDESAENSKKEFSDEEILKAIDFQEKFFDGELYR